jgi:NAD(P)H-hydrate epimerase
LLVLAAAGCVVRRSLTPGKLHSSRLASDDDSGAIDAIASRQPTKSRSVHKQPKRSLSRAEVREVDRRSIEELGVPGCVLMENAGRGLTELVIAELERRGAPLGASVGIVCGRGNNGGDGLVLARHLDLRGYLPRIAYCGRTAEARRDTDAGLNLTIVERAGLELTETPDAAGLAAVLDDWTDVSLLADALFGTGLSSELRESAQGLVETLGGARTPTVAVDIPSGLDCDRGVPLGAVVRAVRTVTFVARKVGFDVPGAEAFTGPVDVVSIGCPSVAWS